ncbi:Protein ABCI12, chloroplastic [Vitis vinifera]|uniref:Protein ABCI12, chloroplastic n=1 Tax=Vitis vinifera TaxID=29760 RepID=A0A438F651_VITVI|nr:Protein ABCI12, chloroplastic [Vitis vinifera]
MNFKFHAFATVTFPSPSSNPTSKALVPPNLSKLYLLNRQNPKPHLSIYKTLESAKCPRLQIRATANNQGESGNWTKWLPRGVVAADRILRLISSATSSPISQPSMLTLVPKLHLCELTSVRPRKNSMAPGSGSLTGKITYHNAFWISCILGLSFSLDSPNTSMDDGAPPLVQLRTPPPAMMGLPNLPDSLGGYSYLVMKLGPLQLTRKGLASLCLTTTTPEQLASALWWFMRPLRFIGVPVAEITLTLLLSLRFISLVFDEVRNVALGIISRRINWQQLTTMETIDIFVSYVRRIFKNIFSHAEQISQVIIS